MRILLSIALSALSFADAEADSVGKITPIYTPVVTLPLNISPKPTPLPPATVKSPPAAMPAPSTPVTVTQQLNAVQPAGFQAPLSSDSTVYIYQNNIVKEDDFGGGAKE